MSLLFCNGFCFCQESVISLVLKSHDMRESEDEDILIAYDLNFSTKNAVIVCIYSVNQCKLSTTSIVSELWFNDLFVINHKCSQESPCVI